jgi:hypothetical protein
MNIKIGDTAIPNRSDTNAEIVKIIVEKKGATLLVAITYADGESLYGAFDSAEINFCAVTRNSPRVVSRDR